MPSAEHPVFKKPSDLQAVIWRYMDFTKFVSMLESSSLFFARADCLGDPFEGSYSRGNERLRPVMYKDMPAAVAAKLHAEGAAFAQYLRKWTFVSCWHMNEGESAAMWKLYARTNEAVALRTSLSRLDHELDEKTYLGAVEYIDFETAWLPEGNALYPYVHKRTSFAHEREVRAVIPQIPVKGEGIDMTKEPPEGGIERAVNLQRMLEAVYVAPTCPAWFVRTVERVVKRYGLQVPVTQSSLDAQPFF